MIATKQIPGLLKSTAARWSDCNAPRLGASLSFYMLLSIAPLMILMIAICGLVFSQATAQQEILAQVRGVSGTAGEKTVAMLLESAHQPKSGILATIVAFATLLSGASGVFMELRDSLNIIWSAPKNAAANWKTMIWQRIISFGMVLSLGFLLLVSLILSAAITIVENFFTDRVPVHFAAASHLANNLLSLIAVAVLFALIYKFVPDVPIDWRDVGVGAVVTALLFSLGKTLLAWYLGTVGVGSTYGAAGSLVAMVVWVYYSAQIFFFGATFTRVYADTYGSMASKRKRKQATQHSGLEAKTQSA